MGTDLPFLSIYAANSGGKYGIAMIIRTYLIFEKFPGGKLVFLENTEGFENHTALPSSTNPRNGSECLGTRRPAYNFQVKALVAGARNGEPLATWH
jgi:hypothetical protein